MMKVRKSLELTPEQWETLDKLSSTLGQVSQRGPTAKKPSWRVLIESIANGAIQLTKGTER